MNFALSAQIMKSPLNAKLTPAPATDPATEVMTSLSIFLSLSVMMLFFSIMAAISIGSPDSKTPWSIPTSPPAENERSSPLITSTFTSSFVSALRIASSNSAPICVSSAFKFSLHAIAMTAIPSSTV